MNPMNRACRYASKTGSCCLVLCASSVSPEVPEQTNPFRYLVTEHCEITSMAQITLSQGTWEAVKQNCILGSLDRRSPCEFCGQCCTDSSGATSIFQRKLWRHRAPYRHVGVQVSPCTAPGILVFITYSNVIQSKGDQYREYVLRMFYHKTVGTEGLTCGFLTAWQALYHLLFYSGTNCSPQCSTANSSYKLQSPGGTLCEQKNTH